MKRFALSGATLIALFALLDPLHAAQYPQRSVRVLVAQGAGGLAPAAPACLMPT